MLKISRVQWSTETLFTILVDDCNWMIWSDFTSTEFILNLKKPK